ncbi:biotin transporter BioY [Virgibacillus alimentarius]|uniref:Biotin transporter n=1 Tax=Virgibacillus alimentarius TaxID=698769 RepID=A0ABS4S6U7_9BACI|nr:MULTISPECIES: biotin transporter BioY [Virgibacillus]MBP2257234.1 biotin transport system substrate-specific component [Virgibacillus alimentarius]HLR67383.1 biotin transporter BioY [Virgibacillus sp.]
MKKSKWTPLNITLGSLFVALTAVGSNITSIAPFLVVGGVPITLQTFFAVLAGIVLGSRLGAFSMFIYMVLGLAGAPIFAQFKGGIAMILSPTFGFIISFILIAYVAGKIAEKKRTLPMYIIAALTGTAINYIFGTNWMYAAYLFWFEAPEGFTYKLAWLWMIVPLPKDILLAIFAGSLAYRLEKITLISSKIKNQRHTA